MPLNLPSIIKSKEPDKNVMHREVRFESYRNDGRHAALFNMHQELDRACKRTVNMHQSSLDIRLRELNSLQFIAHRWLDHYGRLREEIGRRVAQNHRRDLSKIVLELRLSDRSPDLLTELQKDSLIRSRDLVVGKLIPRAEASHIPHYLLPKGIVVKKRFLVSTQDDKGDKEGPISSSLPAMKEKQKSKDSWKSKLVELVTLCPRFVNAPSR